MTLPASIVSDPAEDAADALLFADRTAELRAALLAEATAPLRPVAETFATLDDALDTIGRIGGRPVARSVRKLRRTLSRTEPSVTMIGQVKSGKTSLVNAMAGRPDLLPADVNPWTSVVTSLHLGPAAATDSGHALFRFFDADQWDRLMSKGGRIGELAGRAGADEELAKVSAQLEAMRKKSRRRLGSQFELLMGQEHKYGYVDPELIQRYVCLGDDFDDTFAASEQGRFADITKSADLYLRTPEYPLPLCIRDTPGVNDTFMMREQITVQAIRESRCCCVVLSAHQALSAVDMALIRMIANMPSRDVVIFVNRIDELADAGEQVNEIENSIRQTISDHRGPVEAEILFGSAYWANHALNDSLEEMDGQSADALFSWAEAELGDLPVDEEGRLDPAAAWALSGVPELFGALAGRVQDTVGTEAADSVARSGLNLAATVASARLAPAISIQSSAGVPEQVAVPAEFDRLQERLLGQLEEAFEPLVAEFHQRLDRAHAGFVERALAALVRHLETHGESVVWTYDPTGLRILLRSACTVFFGRASGAAASVFQKATSEVAALYVRTFAVNPASVTLAPPAVPKPPAPVILGETTALDLNAGWWSRWWKRRRGLHAYAADLEGLIAAETRGMVDALKHDYGEADLDRARATLLEFLDTQRTLLLDLWMQDDVDAEAIRLRLKGADVTAMAEALSGARATLQDYVSKGPREAS